jgi:hypothetical protein
MRATLGRRDDPHPLEEFPMKSLVTALIACSLLLPFGTALADETTAPGQVKKEAGDQSAKEYAPGQQKASEAGATEREKHQVRATEEKQHQEKVKGDKAKADAGKPTPEVGAGKAKGSKAPKGAKGKKK